MNRDRTSSEWTDGRDRGVRLFPAPGGGFWGWVMRRRTWRVVAATAGAVAVLLAGCGTGSGPPGGEVGFLGAVRSTSCCLTPQLMGRVTRGRGWTHDARGGV